MRATNKRINAAAIKLFAERGSLDLTMSELAEAAQVSRGTLYRNVESIERLFDQVVEELAIEWLARVGVAMDRHGDTDPAARLAVGLRLFVRLAHENQALGRFIVRFGMTDTTLRGILSGPPMHDIEQGVAARRYTLGGATELGVASLVIGTVVSAVWMVLEGHQGWREAGSSAAELLLRALGITAEEAGRIAVTDLPDLPLD
ncbi:MAG: transcriptional regulator, TetR family [Nocardia sp.]|uniref:TetR/AcrR family transcriptional regulator n=1 Tax=Nocardia sp. TaxID=1821 RepID=UPI0026178398|nr:TetR/AcrR family transcriptional regulator [Nocardia sp.]MCU1648057.1 transcriptional regulator, TetR family [Nocardia sp.]